MISRIIHTITLLLTSGVFFHHCTLIGIFCGCWAFFGATEEAEQFSRLFNPNPYMLIALFVFMYRFLLKRTLRDDGELDLKLMFFYLLGDFIWAVIAMFCTDFFFISWSTGSSSITKGKAQ